MLSEVWEFLKHPQNRVLDLTPADKKNRFAKLLLLAVSFSLLSGILLGVITALFHLDFGTHAAEKLLQEFSALTIFFLAVILAPALEELLFRGPLVFFKTPKSFKLAFYISILLFGLIHLTNFEDLNGQYWAAPIVVLPQLFAGTFLGFIRIRQGLPWSILLHAAHNFVLVGPLLLAKLFDIPVT